MKGIAENKDAVIIAPSGGSAGSVAALTATPNRLLSLDALRGFDMFWIVCGEGIFHSIAGVIKQKHALQQSTVNWQITVTNQLNFFETLFIRISNQLHHTVWHGFTFYDLIFPLFIFIAGVSMPFSFRKFKSEKDIHKKREIRKILIRKLIKRTLLLILLGMVVNGALDGLGYAETRFASVLGRIALACFFAAIIYLNASLRKQLIWFAGILFGYWALMELVPVPHFGGGTLTPEGNLAAYVDRLFLPGKLHRGVYDPEGILSTIPSIASAMLGVFTGQFLLRRSEPGLQKSNCILLFVSGAFLLFCGFFWGQFFPINKNLWTSSFVLFAGGWSVLLFSFFYAVIDVANFQKWSLPFVWMGRNAILIYLAAHGIINFAYTSEFLFGGIFKLFAAVWQPVLLWIGVAIIQFGLLYFLNKKKWFFKV